MSFDDMKARLAALRSARPAEPKSRPPPTGVGETRSRAPWGEVLHAAKPPDATGRKGSPSSTVPVAAVPPGQAGHTSGVGATARGGSATTTIAQEAAEVQGSPFEMPAAKSGPGKISKTLGLKQLRRDAKKETSEPYPDVERPKTRGDCFGGPRPCPFVSCKYHTYLDVTPKGSLVINRPDVDVADLKASCSLDIADGGPQTLESVGALLNLTRERARQLEQKALVNAEKAFPAGEVRMFRGSCKAVSAYSGRTCKLPAHGPNVQHHDGRHGFKTVAEPGQTRFEERERFEDEARAVRESAVEAAHV